MKGMKLNMDKIKKGDIVGRISYEKDIIFEVKRIIKTKQGKKIVLLKGITERIEADSDISDLELLKKEVVKEKIRVVEEKLDRRIKVNQKDIDIKRKEENEINKRLFYNYITGRILHLDGDKKYGQKSQKYYQKMGLTAVVKNIPEYMQPRQVYRMLAYYKPDILVITGHDGLVKKDRNYDDIYNYRNSRYFVQTVQEARRYERDFGANIAIFAGACQSYFEALIMAGANFASSPARILIDMLDPIIVAKKIATSEETKYITIDDIEQELRDGKRGVGGIGSSGMKKSILIRDNFF